MNADTSVNILDMSALSSYFHTGHADYDLNGDGLVNTLDMSLMSARYLASCSVADP